jgi:hypothetical protein
LIRPQLAGFEVTGDMKETVGWENPLADWLSSPDFVCHCRLRAPCQGSVVDRSRLRPPRSGYQWTRKVQGKTLTVALTASEFKAMAGAIANERRLSQTLRQMEQISRRILFHNRSQGRSRNHLRQKVLGLT